MKNLALIEGKKKKKLNPQYKKGESHKRGSQGRWKTFIFDRTKQIHAIIKLEVIQYLISYLQLAFNSMHLT